MERRPKPAELARLSERELEVLTHIADGATNPEIAERLYLSERTVLDDRDRAAAILAAFRSGLVKPGN